MDTDPPTPTQPSPSSAAEMLQRCFYPRVGATVQVLSPLRSSAFAALVTAAPSEELGVWGVQALGPPRGEEQRVHYSRLASTWGLPSAEATAAGGVAATAAAAAAPPLAAASAAAEVSGEDRRPLVAIVGAGLGGLAAAAALQRWGARVRVFERDGSFDERKQGYGLTMQQGGAAIRALGAEQMAAACVTPTLHVSFTSDGTALGRYGHDARCGAAAAAAGAGDGGDRPPPKKKRKRRSNKGNFLIPRQRLRQELLDLLEPGTVEWGCNFESYQSISTVAAEDEVSPEQAISNSSQATSAGVAVRQVHACDNLPLLVVFFDTGCF